MNSDNRIFYLDILKTVAIFAVIYIHVSNIGVNTMLGAVPVSNYLEIFKFAVPVFLMISGTLLLNRNYPSVKSFLKKRITRITLPYLFWFIPILIVLIFTTPDFTYSQLPSIIAVNFFNLGMAWYFWMILGVYFFVPVINEFIKNKGVCGAGYIALMFIASSILYQSLVCLNIVTFIDLRFFITPVGFMALGYWLSNHNFKNEKLIMVLSVVLFIITSVLKVKTNWFSLNMTHLIYDNFNIALSSFMDVSIVEIIQSGSVFLFIKYISGAGILQKMKGFFISVSRCCYGMYFVHIFLYLFIFHFVSLPQSPLKLLLLIVGGSAAIFVLSYIIVFAVSRISKIKKLTGYY